MTTTVPLAAEAETEATWGSAESAACTSDTQPPQESRTAYSLLIGAAMGL